MAEPTVLDLEALLAPIPGESPAGRDLRKDASPNPIYYQIKDARESARDAERRLDAAGDDPEAAATFDPASAWKKVLDIAPAVIAGESKDLEIASFLCEALLRRHGFAGLREGFLLIRGLVERYWETVYPLPDPEDEDPIAYRVRALTNLNGADADGTLIQPIRKVPITDCEDPGPFATWFYKQTMDFTRNPERKAQRIEQLKESVRRTPVPFYRALFADLDGCEQAFAEMTALLDQTCGSASPPSSNIRNALREVRETVQTLTEGIAALREPAGGEEEVSAAPGTSGGAAETAAGAGTAVAVPGAIRSREEAFRTLLRIAEFFRQTEPHSPISYTLEEVVRRGRLPLPDLLKELIPDEAQRVGFLLRAGVEPPRSE